MEKSISYWEGHYATVNVTARFGDIETENDA